VDNSLHQRPPCLGWGFRTVCLLTCIDRPLPAIENCWPLLLRLPTLWPARTRTGMAEPGVLAPAAGGQIAVGTSIPAATAMPHTALTTRRVTVFPFGLVYR